MSPTVDLDRYFARIGYRGSTAPTLETLNALVSAHVEAIPFENLDVLLDRGIALDDDVVDAKLLDAGRGGYCFEQNTLFLRVLTTLGFRARPLSARVRLQRPRDFTPPRTHVFCEVMVGGHPYVADVGVGGLSPTAAFRLDVEDPQPTPHEPRRVVREDGRSFHQAWLGDAWSDVCEFTGEEMPRIDREVANWFTSAHPESHFRNRLLAARARPDGGRVTLLNRELTERTRGEVRRTTIETPAALLEVLRVHFGLVFAPETRFRCAALDFPEG